jgi:ergothioneine biosynthesis protein EgtB
MNQLKTIEPPRPEVSALFATTRARSDMLAAPLSAEDMMLQSMTDASPAKWHLAHTTWFFEEFILKPRVPGYRSPDDRFAVLFNSYYVQAGPRHARDKRGLISRPSLAEVMQYRQTVEAGILDLLVQNRADLDDISDLVELGCHHEMQHQELLVTDLLHALSYNPLLPAYREPLPFADVAEQPLTFTAHAGGLTEIGHDGAGFSFDCEGPRHQTYVGAFQIADRPVSNRDWIAFMQDGGYRNETLWLMDGWATRRREGWEYPLYWWQQEDRWWTFTLHGAQRVDLDAPVVHVSYYEADAFARWAGARLPTETEWEVAGRKSPIEGNFLETDVLQPRPGGGMWGDVWEWTQSPFTPYPGFRTAAGAIGEYNGKFMVNQFVLRGGSCATPLAQMRQSYRTFFYPHQRWQMLGLRLAKDA